MSRQLLRVFDGCLKQGAYKSVKVYFSAVIRHQVRIMGVAVSADLQRCIADTTRSALRGAGRSQLKEHFHVPVLSVVIHEEAGPHSFTPERADHMGDALLICSWWMFREIESARAQVCHVSMNSESGGLGGDDHAARPEERCSWHALQPYRTVRVSCSKTGSLPVSCNEETSPAEAIACRAPLFPSPEGRVMSKEQFVGYARVTLQACAVEVGSTKDRSCSVSRDTSPG